jgi:SAM-dependent methyltransferase
MAEPLRDSKDRFSDRVDDYLKYRPRYQRQIVDALATVCGLAPQHVIADVGCGTGFAAEPFLHNGNRVIGIEPNREMREAGAQFLANFPNFEMCEGAAESTGLADASIDFVLAGQSFHWFPAEATRAEFARILKPDGWVVLVWQDRSLDANPFHRDYEELLQRYATDYKDVAHRHVGNPEIMARFFAPQQVKLISLETEQRLDYDGLRGRLLSSSYIPREGPQAEAMLTELLKLFAKYAQNGHVLMLYETKIFYGHLRA